MEIPSSIERVPANTPGWINTRIRQETETRIHYFSQRPDEIDARLKELDEEWDIERALETNAAALALGGTVLGLFGRKWWLVLPLAVTGFLLQHGVQGWCPPVPLLRRLGFRTPQEIEAERYALKSIRGDFAEVGREGATAAVRATRRDFGRRRFDDEPGDWRGSERRKPPV